MIKIDGLSAFVSLVLAVLLIVAAFRLGKNGKLP